MRDGVGLHVRGRTADQGSQDRGEGRVFRRDHGGQFLDAGQDTRSNWGLEGLIRHDGDQPQTATAVTQSEVASTVSETSAARAARTQRFARIHLTFCAPGCERLPPEHPGRNRVFWGQPQIAVLRALLSRLQLSPGQVRVRTEDPPLIEVHLMAEIDGLDCPVASLCEGFTADEATALLHQLEGAGLVSDADAPTPARSGLALNRRRSCPIPKPSSSTAGLQRGPVQPSPSSDVTATE